MSISLIARGLTKQRKTNLLCLHWRVPINALHLPSIHLLTWCTIRSRRARLNLRRVHVAPVVPGLGDTMATTDAVVWRRHSIVAWMALHMLRGDLGSCWRDALGSRACCGFTSVRGGFFAGHDIDEEVEHVGLGERGGDIATLQCTALVLFGMDPGAHRQLCDEDVAALGKEDRCLSRNHFHFWIGFHNFLDAGQRQLVQFVVMGFGFKVGDYMLPVGCQNVFIGAVEALVDLDSSAPSNLIAQRMETVHLPKPRYRIPQREHSLGPQADFVSK
jgi:hypothetical protein